MKPAVIVCFLLAIGCGPAPASDGAASTVKRYQLAVKKNDPRAAYALLSKQTKQGLSFDQFARLWKSRRAELDLQSKQLDRALDLDPNLGTRAVVTYKDGKRASLSREDSSWRLEVPLSGSATATKPRDVIRLLAKALATRNYNSVISLLSSERRKAIHNQLILAFTNSLTRNLDLPLQRIGDKFASLTWEDQNGHYKLVLVLENDEWRIHDVHITPKNAD